MTKIKKPMKKSYFVIVLLTFFLLAGCDTSSSDESDATENEEKTKASAEELYVQAKDLLVALKYKDAAKAFDEVEREHPFSDYAPRSQIMAAFAYYRAEHYDDAVLSLKRYIDLYPAHESVDYAYYLIAVCYYEQISDVGRDQGMTRLAKDALTDVVRRFPDTDYARDAKLKLDLTNDHLAGKEMMVGRYYANRKEYLAAANRFRAVIEQYDTTSHTPEALHRLVELYLLLGIKEQAVHYAAVLGHNFPGNEWYARSYALLDGKQKEAVSTDPWWQVW
jgi:outer membrane protein assembly factor BamD